MVRAKVISVSCLSGGSGKTTTALNLAVMLSDKGKTLAVDFDPQGNLSQWMGLNDLSESATVAETILSGEDRVEFLSIISDPQNEDRKGKLQIAPSDYSLARAADAITMQPGREKVLKRALKPIFDTYDYIVIDSPPSKGILTYNAILASDLVVIPTECTHKGVMGALSTIVLINELEDLEFDVPKLLGVIPTRDQWAGANRTRMSRAAIDSLTESLTSIPLFPSLKQSTVVQQANNMGWSLQEAGETELSKPFCIIVDSILKHENNSKGK
jgi:chromosome partitioning protein